MIWQEGFHYEENGRLQWLMERIGVKAMNAMSIDFSRNVTAKVKILGQQLEEIIIL